MNTDVLGFVVGVCEHDTTQLYQLSNLKVALAVIAGCNKVAMNR